MDEFDYELDSDFDDENEEIVIETNEDVINFDDGFYTEDKAVHILNLLSNNNLRIDVAKFKKYWDRKIANILTIDETAPAPTHQYNKNLFPLADVKKKVSNYTDKPCVYEESEYVTQPIEKYLLARRDIVVPYYYTPYTEEKQYSVLSPYETPQQGAELTKDIDAHYQGERIRLVRGAERLLAKGYISSPPNPTPTETIQIDIADYIQSLESLEKGDPVTIHIMDGTSFKGKCVENDTTAHTLTLSVNKKTLEYDYHNLSKNSFIVWPTDLETPLPFNKSILTHQCVIANSADSKYNHEAKEFLSLSANDVMALLLNEQPRTLDEIKDAFNDILDNVKRNKFLSDVFQKYKPAKTAKRKRASIKATLKTKTTTTSIETVINQIKEWLTSNVNVKVAAAGPATKQEHPKQSQSDTKFFFNVEDMYNDKPTDSKKKAVLVTFASSYKVKNTIKYLDASAFSLVAKVVDNGKLAWDIVEPIALPSVPLSAPSSDQTVKGALDNLAKYQIHSRPASWNYSRLPFKYKGKRSYANFQGQGELEVFEDIPEFGIKMDKMEVEDDDADETEEISKISYEGTFLKYFVKHLSNLFSVKLTLKQIEYISKTLNLTKEVFESKGKQDALQVFKAFLVCTSMLIIFVQISFPEAISSASEAAILSFPLLQTEPKNFALINYFVTLTEKKVLKDPLFANIMPSEVSLPGLFEHSITKVLKDKPIFTVLLNTCRNKLRSGAPSQFTEKYGLWKTFRPAAKAKKASPLQTLHIHKTLLIRKPRPVPLLEAEPKLNQAHVETLLTPPNLNPEVINTWTYQGNDPLLIAINDATTKESAYNALSLQIDSMTSGNPTLEQFVRNATTLKADHLSNFFFYDMKDLFGKILYNFVQTSEKENPNNKEYLQLFFATPATYQEQVRARLQTFVDEIANMNPATSKNADDKYVLIYLMLLLIGDVGEPFSNYLIEMFNEKYKYNSITSQESMNLYLRDREQRKQKVMQVYNEMDDQIRRITRDFVEIGLITRDALINTELNKENIELRVANENEDYDMNAED